MADQVVNQSNSASPGGGDSVVEQRNDASFDDGSAGIASAQSVEDEGAMSFAAQDAGAAGADEEWIALVSFWAWQAEAFAHGTPAWGLAQLPPIPEAAAEGFSTTVLATEWVWAL